MAGTGPGVHVRVVRFLIDRTHAFPVAPATVTRVKMLRFVGVAALVVIGFLVSSALLVSLSHSTLRTVQSVRTTTTTSGRAASTSTAVASRVVLPASVPTTTATAAPDLLDVWAAHVRDYKAVAYRSALTIDLAMKGADPAGGPYPHVCAHDRQVSAELAVWAIDTAPSEELRHVTYRRRDERVVGCMRSC